MMEKNGERGLVFWRVNNKNLLWPAKANSQSVITAKAHASVRMREPAAVFLRMILLN